MMIRLVPFSIMCITFNPEGLPRFDADERRRAQTAVVSFGSREREARHVPGLLAGPLVVSKPGT